MSTSPALRAPPRSFAHPEGIPGRAVGALLRRFNSGLNRAAVARLDPRPGERVLEIGFGPGHALELLSRRAGASGVAGIDPSQLMVRAAERRNRTRPPEERVEVRRGRAEQLPWDPATFSAVLTVNNLLFWEPPEAGLSEVRRVLKPGGRVLVAFHSTAARRLLATKGDPLDQLATLLGPWLRRVGLEPGTPEKVPTWSGAGLLFPATRSLA